jgi:hypothetical protein
MKVRIYKKSWATFQSAIIISIIIVFTKKNCVIFYFFVQPKKIYPKYILE